ncbi:MAG: lysophospholipid acyltransferase family protein [Arcobacter sp.]|nr:lysophospholipid acyltransferase family protein [Arcobacter sp.]
MKSKLRKIKKNLLISVLPFFLQLFAKIIYLTNKKVFIYPANMNDENFILSFWHGDLLMQPFNYRAFKINGVVKVIISEHSDGEIIRRTVEHLGVNSLSGSSTRGGAKALLGAIKALQNGIDVAITPDGPKGPAHSIADGIIMIAQKTNSKILCFGSKPSSYWKLNSWDSFIIPKPFGTIKFIIGEPFLINGLSIEDAKEKINKNMERLYE